MELEAEILVVAHLVAAAPVAAVKEVAATVRARKGQAAVAGGALGLVAVATVSHSVECWEMALRALAEVAETVRAAAV